VDLNKLSTSEKIIGASGIVLLIASFLSWFTIDEFASWSGWEVQFVWGRLPVLLGLVMVAHVAISNFAPDLALPDLPWPKVHLCAGGAAAALVVLKVLIGHDVDTLIGALSTDRSVGLFVAALGAIGLGIGGFLYDREHGASATGRGR
jgi:hypothetical protein